MKSASSTCGTRAATAGRGRALSRRGPRPTSATRSPSPAAIPEIQRSIARRRSSLSHARLLEAPRRETPRAAELAGEGLREREAVRGAEERPHDLGDEGAVEGMARVGGRDEVGVAGESRTREGHHRLRGHARDLGVEDDDRPRLEQIGGGEDGAQRGGLPGHPVVRRADAVSRAQALGGDEGLPIHDRGVPDDVGRAVRRAPVHVQQRRPLPGELPVEGDVGGPHDRSHAVGMVEGGQPDQDVHLADGHQLGQQLVGENRAHSHRSLNQKKSYGPSVITYGRSRILGNRLRPNISMGMAPVKAWRSSSTAWAVPDRLFTTSTFSESRLRT